MDKPCKVLHIALAHGGGVEIYTRMLIEHTFGSFDTVLVCSPDYVKHLLPKDSCRIYDIDVPREISLFKDLKAAFDIREIMKKEKPDVVYCHSSMAGAIGRIAALGLGCKVVYNPHGWSFDMAVSKKKRLFYKILERMLAKITDKIVTISEYEKNVAIENKVCRKEKIRVILNGIDLKKCHTENVQRHDFGLDNGDFVVGCCARISEQKDPMLFASVAGYIAKMCPEARFVWVGDGELKEDFIDSLKKNNVYEKMLITGWTDNPYKYISLFDVAVLFSKWEGFGMCLCEYLALGKPVVATDVGAISEVLEDGIHAKVVKSREVQVLANAVISFRQSEDLDDLENACIKAAEKFDFKITADKTVKMIDTL